MARDNSKPKSKIENCKSPDFPEWLNEVSPWWQWDWPHQNYLYLMLDRVTTGESKRLMIFMPPRHAKSETVTVRYSAWRLERDKKLNIILGSYNQKLANRFSRRIRAIASERMALSKERRAADEWETLEGGGVRAVGAGAGVTGFGAGLIMIDDPVKNRAQAESQTYRDNTWDWFNDDIYTRLEPGGAIILIQTRWHDDDLSGRLIKEMEQGGEHWEVVSLPALAESEVQGSKSDEGDGEKGGNATVMERGGKRSSRFKVQGSKSEPEGAGEKGGNATVMERVETGAEPPDCDLEIETERQAFPHEHGASPDLKSKIEDSKSEIKDPTSQIENRKSQIENRKSGDPLGRLPGQALWPERYNEEMLAGIRRKIGAYSFAALYQQRPVPHEGGLFKRKWFNKIVAKAPEVQRWARGYDLAVSTRTSADYTASFRCGFDTQGNLFIADGFRKRIEYPEQRRYVVERMKLEKGTEHGIEKALHGQAFVQDLRQVKEVRGVPFKAVRVDADKYTRALGWANLAEEGKVYLVAGAWIDDFLDEVCRFTGRGDAHDDQIDAVSLAVGLLKGRRGTLLRF